MGRDLALDGFSVAIRAGNPQSFAAAVTAVRSSSTRPLILMSRDPAIMAAGLSVLTNETPLIYGADATNLEAFANLAKQYKAPLGVLAPNLDTIAELTEKLKALGVEDLVLDPGGRDLGSGLTLGTQIRRLAVKKNFRALGFPVIAFPGDAAEPGLEAVAAAQALAKYAGFIILDTFTPALAYPLLVLRQNIYTDPQKPIQMNPGLYRVGNPDKNSPVLMTVNFSLLALDQIVNTAATVRCGSLSTCCEPSTAVAASSSLIAGRKRTCAASSRPVARHNCWS